MRRIGSSSAFTLIELLSVIAIIAVLASILSVGLGSARSKADRIFCSSQLRQHALAAEMYRQDNKGLFFPYQESVPSRDSGSLMVRYWFGAVGRGAEGERSYDRKSSFLNPYLDSSKISICPAFPYGRDFVKLKFSGLSSGYGYNIHLSKDRWNAREVRYIRRPSTTVVFTDAAQINTFQFPATAANPLLEEFYMVAGNQQTVHFRHGETTVSVMVDGHVENLTAERDGVSLRSLRGQVVGSLHSRMLANEY